MKTTKFFITLVLFVMVLVFSQVVEAQLPQPCDSLNVTTVDTISVGQITAKPGSQVAIPIALSNTKDAFGFKILVSLDTTYLKPIIEYVDTSINSSTIIDTLIIGTDTTIDTTVNVDTLVNINYQHDTTSRFNLIVDPGSSNDGMSVLYPAVYNDEDLPDTNVNNLRIKMTGAFRDIQYYHSGINSGTGDIMYIYMNLAPNTPHNTIIPINFYEGELYVPDSIPPILIGCQITEYIDTLGFAILPTVIAGYVKADTSDVPVINSFTANPATITQGQSTTLSWDVTGADQITIDNGVGDVTGLTSITVSPSSTISYRLTATNASGSVTSVPVTVTVNPVGSNNPPVVAQVVPSTYTITEGENVSFSVTASDADGDPITLSALNLPANATFGIGGQVTGVGSVSGNFSFSPNTGQAGVYQIQFQATDDKGGASGIVTVTITVEEIEFDILFSTSTLEGSPVGGLPGKRSVLFPIDLVTAQTVYGVQFDMMYDAEHFEVDSIITTPRTADYVVYDNIGATPGRIRVVTFGMNNEPIIVDTTDNTAILYVAMSIDSTTVPGNYPVYLENGWESVNPDPSYPSLPLVTDSGIIQVDMLGDVNLDQHIDVADAVNIVASILGNITLTQRQFDAADVTTNLVVDVFDLVGVIDIIYGAPFAPVQEFTTEEATVSLAYNDLMEGASDMMVVRSEIPEDIAGVQLDITYDPRSVTLGRPVPAEDAQGLQLVYKNDGGGHMKVLLHFTNPFNEDNLIKSGQADLVEIPIVARTDIEYGDNSQVRLTDVLLSTPSAAAVRVNGFGATLPKTFTLYQNYPNPFNPTTVIEFSLDGGSDGEMQHVSLDIFNILGQHVHTLVDGELSTGHYQYEWRGTDQAGRPVATGVYLYKLQVDNRSDSKKMLLLK